MFPFACACNLDVLLIKSPHFKGCCSRKEGEMTISLVAVALSSRPPSASLTLLTSRRSSLSFSKAQTRPLLHTSSFISPSTSLSFPSSFSGKKKKKKNPPHFSSLMSFFFPFLMITHVYISLFLKS